MKNETGVPWLALFTLVVVILGGVFINKRKQYYMQKGTAQSCATVFELTSSDAYGNKMIYYHYYADTVRYTGYETSDYFEECERANNCVGFKFKIVYATANPEIAESYFDQPCE